MVTEDSKTSQEQAAPAPELAPYLLESARSSRAKCRTCKRKIQIGKLRLGILLEGPYGTGYLWHHLVCAARHRIEDVEAAYAQKAFTDGMAVPPLAELQALQEKAEKERAERKEPPYVERAPSGRSKCKNCGEVIAKEALRIVLAREISFGSQVRATSISVHVGCVRAELDAKDCLTEIDGFAEQLRKNSELETSVVDDALAAVGDLES